MSETKLSTGGERRVLWTGYEFHCGEWLAMYCNVSTEQTERDSERGVVWVRNDEAAALRRSASTGVAAAVAAERERCAEIARDHECGDHDDITCQHRNCAMLIAAAIRNGGE